MRPLMKSNVESVLGMTIEWTAEGYNRNYGGKCIINSVDFDKEHPLTVETLNGDDLSFAYVQKTGLKSMDGTEQRYVMDKSEKSFTYSDDFREVMFRIAKGYIHYKSHDGRTYDVVIKEDDENWYVDFQTGLGEGVYPKADFTLEKALENQDHIYDESYI